MKTAKILFVPIFQIITLSMLVQSPQLINYEGVARDGNSINLGKNMSSRGTDPYTIVAEPILNLLTSHTLSISGGNSLTIAPKIFVSRKGSLNVSRLSNSVNITLSLIGTGAVTVHSTKVTRI